MSFWNHLHLSQSARAILMESGWTEHRNISIEAFRDANESVELTFCDAANELLRSVGGLRFRYPHFSDRRSTVTCSLDPVFACDNANIDRIRGYESHLDTVLTVIGEANNGYLSLLIAADGRIVGGIDYSLIFIGDNPANAINTLCEGKKTKAVEIARPDYSIVPTKARLHKGAIDILRRAGWMPGVEESSSDDPIEQFIQVFGGHVVNIICADGSTDQCKFLSSKKTVSWQIPEEINRVCSLPVVPIAESIESHMRFVMAKDGCVFGFLPELPESFWYFGGSGEEAINNIVLGQGGELL